jgi:hypothetical protein
MMCVPALYHRARRPFESRLLPKTATNNYGRGTHHRFRA